MVDQFVETWRINNRVNLLLLEEISEKGLHVTLSARGAGTPAKQFAHIHNVRFWKLEKLAPHLAKDQSKISLKSKFTHEILRYKLIESSQAVEKMLRKGFENDGCIKGYPRGAITLMGYLIAHESHHRGNMLLTLKQCGHELPRSVSYGIWDWNKI